MTGGKHALMIRQDVLLEYLKMTEQVLILPMLIEKRVRNWHSDGVDKAYKYVQSGGYAIMDKKGKIKYKIRQYDKRQSTLHQFMAKHISPSLKKARVRILDMGVKLHLIQLPSDAEWMDYRLRAVLKKRD